jgi:hypothetical protein
MSMRLAMVCFGLVACTRAETPAPAMPQLVVVPDAAVPEPAITDVPSVAIAGDSGEVWLKGSTHVHAAPSGDSTTSIPDVIAWYESNGYDFIAITDHNRISELDAWDPTIGQSTIRNADSGIIVFAGIELTYNPTGCLPVGDPSGNCRIHVNLLGTTGRFAGRLEWANREDPQRLAKYQAALDQQKRLGGLAQLNHPQWLWGMTPELLTELARRGMSLVEIANVQFEKWNAGDATHPSTEALWDAALAAGVTLWGVASDDAHHYAGGGKYPAGGGFIAVKARRDPQAILDAIAAGRFYSSTGVTLSRAEVVSNELVVEVVADPAATYTIEHIENGKLVASVPGTSARRAVPASGYVRAVVTRNDGKRAWVQPQRR